MPRALIWPALLIVLGGPVLAAGFSPYLAWRQPIYIAAGFAGIVGLALMPLQPLAVAGRLPGLSQYHARRLHRLIGPLLLACVLLHVAGLWITSPPDVIDALLLRAPAPFSLWGVVAMWALFAATLLALLRKRLRLRWQTWRRAHGTVTLLAVAATGLHAMLITGTMELYSKLALVVFATLISAKTVWDLRLWHPR